MYHSNLKANRPFIRFLVNYSFLLSIVNRYSVKVLPFLKIVFIFIR